MDLRTCEFSGRGHAVWLPSSENRRLLTSRHLFSTRYQETFLLCSCHHLYSRVIVHVIRCTRHQSTWFHPSSLHEEFFSTRSALIQRYASLEGLITLSIASPGTHLHRRRHSCVFVFLKVFFVFFESAHRDNLLVPPVTLFTGGIIITDIIVINRILLVINYFPM